MAKYKLYEGSVHIIYEFLLVFMGDLNIFNPLMMNITDIELYLTL